MRSAHQRSLYRNGCWVDDCAGTSRPARYALRCGLVRALVADAFNIRPADRSLAVLRVLHCHGQDEQAANWIEAWFCCHPEWGQVAR